MDDAIAKMLTTLEILAEAWEKNGDLAAAQEELAVKTNRDDHGACLRERSVILWRSAEAVRSVIATHFEPGTRVLYFIDGQRHTGTLTFAPVPSFPEWTVTSDDNYVECVPTTSIRWLVEPKLGVTPPPPTAIQGV